MRFTLILVCLVLGFTADLVAQESRLQQVDFTVDRVPLAQPPRLGQAMVKPKSVKSLSIVHQFCNLDAYAAAAALRARLESVRSSDPSLADLEAKSVASAIRVVPHVRTNSVVVRAPVTSIAAVRRVINEIDQMPAQYHVRLRVKQTDAEGNQQVIARPQIITLGGVPAMISLGGNQGTLLIEVVVDEVAKGGAAALRIPSAQSQKLRHAHQASQARATIADTDTFRVEESIPQFTFQSVIALATTENSLGAEVAVYLLPQWDLQEDAPMNADEKPAREQPNLSDIQEPQVSSRRQVRRVQQVATSDTVLSPVRIGLRAPVAQPPAFLTTETAKSLPVSQATGANLTPPTVLDSIEQVIQATFEQLLADPNDRDNN